MLSAQGAESLLASSAALSNEVDHTLTPDESAVSISDSIEDLYEPNVDEQELFVTSVTDEMADDTLREPPKINMAELMAEAASPQTDEQATVSEDDESAPAFAAVSFELPANDDADHEDPADVSSPISNQLVETLNSANGPPAPVDTVLDDFDNAGGTLQIQIGGLVAGDDYDQIQVSGTATLSGTLEVVFTNGFVPVIGDYFDIITFDTLNGRFESAIGLFGDNLSDRYLQITELSDRLRVSVEPLPGASDLSLTSSMADEIAMLFGGDYFDLLPSSLTIDASLTFGNALSVVGTLYIGRVAGGFDLVGDGVGFSFGTPGTLQVLAGDTAFGAQLRADETMAFQVQGANFLLSAGALSSLQADAFAFSFNNTGEAFTGITLGDATTQYTFTDMPAATFRNELVLTGFTAELAGGLQMTGDIAFQAEAGDTLSLIASADDLALTMEAGSLALHLHATQFRMRLETDLANNAVYAVLGTGDLSLTGLADVVFQGAFDVLINTTGRAVIDFGVAGSHDFGTADDLYQFAGTAIQIQFGDEIRVSGDVGLAVQNGRIEVAGGGVRVALEAGTAQAGVELASFGLLITDAGIALETAGGQFLFQASSVAQASALATTVRINETGTAWTGTTIEIGTLAYQFADLAASTDLLEVGVDQFTAVIDGFVNLTGSMGISLSNGQLIAVGQAVSASVGSEGAKVSIGNTDFGLILDQNGLAFELLGNDLLISMAGFAAVSAAGVMVRYADDDQDIAPATLISAAGANYTFIEGVSAGTVQFSVEGLSALVAGTITLAGDAEFSLDLDGNAEAAFAGVFEIADLLDLGGSFTLVFDASTETVRVAGVDAHFAFALNGVDLIDFSAGSGGLLLSESGVAGTLTGDAAFLAGVPNVNITASNFSVTFNTREQAVSESFVVGAASVELIAPAGRFFSVVAQPATLEILGFSLVGNVALQLETATDGDRLVLAFDEVEIAAGFDGEGTGGAALAVENAAGLFIVQPNVGMAGRLEFAANVALPGIDAGTEVALFFNNTSSPWRLKARLVH